MILKKITLKTTWFSVLFDNWREQEICFFSSTFQEENRNGKKEKKKSKRGKDIFDENRSKAEMLTRELKFQRFDAEKLSRAHFLKQWLCKCGLRNCFWKSRNREDPGISESGGICLVVFWGVFFQKQRNERRT